MSQVLIDSSAETPRVIIVERRSLLSQIGGVWFVALPLIAAYLICRMPYDAPEASVSELRLGDNSWQTPRAAQIAAASNSAQPARGVDSPAIAAVPIPPRTVRAESANSKPLANETGVALPTPENTNAPLLPQGVVVLDLPKGGTNPVAVFDPEGKAPGETTEPEQAVPTNRTLEAALKFDGGQPTSDETRQALAEINAAAEKARAERELAEKLKPLLFEHEQAKAKDREKRQAEAERRRIAASRETFLQELGEVLQSDSSIPQQGRQIDLMVRREVDSVNAAPFESIFKRVTSVRSSRANKLRFLLQERVPEALVLYFLIDLDSKDIGKSGGPRDKDHAIVRSAEFLLKGIKGR